MKIRTIGNCVLLFGSLCLVWSGSCRQLCAGQGYRQHVTVFGNSSEATVRAQKLDPAEEADIRQLMDLAGTKTTVMQTLSAMEESIRPLMLRALPPGPYRQRLVELFFEKFQTRATPQYFINLAVPVYAQYLSDADIKGLIQFYKTPLGQKWIRTRPKLMAGVLTATHSSSRELGREIMREVLQEHPDLAQEFKAAEQAAHQH